MIDLKETLKTLCELDGVPGYEDEVREYIEAFARPLADEVIVDAMGNLIVFKKGRKPRKRPLMIAAHMDEVGFLVKDITDDGMLKLAAAGGIDPRILIGRRMRVGRNKLPGVISLKAIHLTTAEERKNAPDLKSLYIDLGCTCREQAEALVMCGEPAMFDSKFIPFGDNCVKAKAIDDRVGCAVLMKLLETDLAYDTYFVFTVAEEIGSRGATIAANRIQPGAVIAVEGTTAADMPGVPGHRQSCRQRQGAVVSLIDKRTIYSREFREKILKAADAKGVRWQYRQSANGGTDARVGTTSGPGALAFGIAAPVRYIHCAANVVYMPDVEEVYKLAEIALEEAGELDV